MAKALRPEHADILRYLASGARQGPYQGHDGYLARSAYHGTPHADRPALWAALTRMGLVNSAEQSEHCRGEPRQVWRTYKINEKGLAALLNPSPPNPTAQARITDTPALAAQEKPSAD